MSEVARGRETGDRGARVYTITLAIEVSGPKGGGTVHVSQGRDDEKGLSWLNARFVGKDG